MPYWRDTIAAVASSVCLDNAYGSVICSGSAASIGRYGIRNSRRANGSPQIA
jgi:hypothetical protein